MGSHFFGNPQLLLVVCSPPARVAIPWKPTNLQPEGLSSLLWNLGPVRTSLLHLGRHVKNGGKREGWLFCHGILVNMKHTEDLWKNYLFFLNYSRWFWQKAVIPQESDKHTGRPRSHITSQLCNSGHAYHNLLGPLVIHSNSHSHNGAWCLKAARRWIRLTLELLSAELMVGGNCRLIGPEFIWWTKWKNGSKFSWEVYFCLDELNQTYIKCHIFPAKFCGFSSHSDLHNPRSRCDGGSLGAQFWSIDHLGRQKIRWIPLGFFSDIIKVEEIWYRNMLCSSHLVVKKARNGEGSRDKLEWEAVNLGLVLWYTALQIRIAYQLTQFSQMICHILLGGVLNILPQIHPFKGGKMKPYSPHDAVQRFHCLSRVS